MASFEGDPGRDLTRHLNGILPADVAVTAATAVDDGFDARRDARSRTYCYRLLRRPAPSPFEGTRSLWWPRRIDLEALQACAAALPGSHDFTAFTPTDTDHVHFERNIFRAEWLCDEDHPAADAKRGASDDDDLGRAAAELSRRAEVVSFWIEADAFMRKMVRTLVGTMLEVAGGQRSVEEFKALLEGAPREQAGETAPPHGLYLVWVRY